MESQIYLFIYVFILSHNTKLFEQSIAYNRRA